jgi:hypothetical protein
VGASSRKSTTVSLAPKSISRQQNRWVRLTFRPMVAHCRNMRVRPLKPMVGGGQISGVLSPRPAHKVRVQYKKPILVESYKTTYGHKVVALVSVVEEEQKTGGHWWPARRSPMRRRAGRGTLCPPRLSAPRGRAA